ncbi:glycosyltransferase family 4 protein [Patescibacteria group bacterium]|nr:glycosyltransferase family 4 protein [Patescibacteria group bacterium]
MFDPKELNPDLLKDVKLAIVGGSAFTDDYVKQLHGQATNDESIVFTGYQTGETLEALFAGAKFVVHPSLSEGLPLSVLEAMSYGKAVIASDIPENMEVIDQHGIPFAAGSVDDLAQKIIDLAQNQTAATSIGHTAREFVESEHNWDDIAQETIELYEKHLALRQGVLAME